MKSLVILLGIVAFGLPTTTLGHGPMMDFGSLQTAPAMMQYVEDQSLQNEELHEEMEDLMMKMMAGNLTEVEASRLAQLMDEYPGPMGMMINRMNMGTWGGNWDMMNGFGWGMMNGTATFFAWLAAITWIVWLAVGVLAIAWLWKQIQNG